MATMHNVPGRHAQSQAECAHNSAGTHAQRPAVNMHFPTGVRNKRIGDYYCPCLTLPEPPCIGFWGRQRLQHLRTSQKVLYTTMLMGGTLRDHLEEVDKSAEELFNQLTVQMKAQEGVIEELKVNNQMEWVQQMNNICNRVSEVVYKELINI